MKHKDMGGWDNKQPHKEFELFYEHWHQILADIKAYISSFSVRAADGSSSGGLQWKTSL